MLTPPYHFSIVAAPITPDDDCTQILYRGSLPAARNAPFLRRLGIRTLVYLRKKPLKEDEPLVSWAAKQGIDLQWVRAEKMDEEGLGMEREHVTDVLKILLNPAAYPLYLADVDGISHTTLVVACLRKLQGWHSDCIVNEIYRFEPDHDDLPLVPFITSYLSTSGPTKDDGGALALPPPPYPSWLWPLSLSTSAPPPIGRSERAVSSASNASNASGSALPFPNPLTVRRHPSMRLGFGNVPAQLPQDTKNSSSAGLWRTRSNTAVSRAVSDKARAPSPRDTLNSRSDSGEIEDKMRLPHKVSFHDDVSPSGILSRSPMAMSATLAASSLRYSNDPRSEGLGAEGEAEPERQSSGSLPGDAGDEGGNEYALDDEDDDELDEDEEEYDDEDDEDEEEEEEEEEEEDEEPPMSQYISALDLAGM